MLNLWIKLIFNHFDGIVRVNGRCILVGDGIKIGKEGKKNAWNQVVASRFRIAQGLVQYLLFTPTKLFGKVLERDLEPPGQTRYHQKRLWQPA